MSYRLFFSPPPPTSYEHQFYGVMSGFTKLNIETKYVCLGLTSPHVHFHSNRLVRTVKFAGGEKRK